MPEGTPSHGDRSAWNTDDFETEHAKDINDGNPQYHNPWPASSGQAPVSDGTEYIATDIATQAELNAHAATPDAHHDPVTLDANADTILSLSTQELGLDTKAANIILAGPTSGGAAIPSFRALVNADLPDPLALKDFTTKTISSGAFTADSSAHVVAAESGTTDDLDTISGGVDYQILIIKADAGDTITVKHETGNISLNGGADIALADDFTLLLWYDGSTWSDVGAGGGGSGSSTFLGLTDTPASYSGQAGKYARVNTGETALEFATGTGSGDIDLYTGILINSTVVSAGGLASYDVSSIPADYDRLEIFIQGKSEYAGAVADNLTLSLNGDTTNANYRRLYTDQITSATTHDEADSRLIANMASSNVADMSGQIKITIQNPNGIFRKTVTSIAFLRRNTTIIERMIAGYQWENTNAINQITLACVNGDFAEGTLIQLIGYKETTVGGGAEHTYYGKLAALLEPDAIEPLQSGTISYAVGASETKYLLASFQTRLSGAGRMEVRDPREALPLRNITLSDSAAVGGAVSTAIILDPTIPSYTTPRETYFDRLEAIAELPTKVINFTAASQTKPLLPGCYGMILTGATSFNFTWVIGRMNTYGFNLMNEKGDTGSTDYFRVFNRLTLPLSKLVVCEGQSGASGGTGSPIGSITYVLLPSTWSVVADPNTYSFRDDFMGASLDTGSDWNRTVSSAGNIEIDTLYQWLKAIGNGSWGTNCIFSQTSEAVAAGVTFECDVYIDRAAVLATGVGIFGFHDGAGNSYTDFAHGINFGGGGGIIGIYENGTSRGTVGSGYSLGCVYRIRITLDGAGGATYEIQGGTQYEPIGSAAWDDITPGTSSSGTDPVYAGLSMFGAGPAYVSDMKIYT